MQRLARVSIGALLAWGAVSAMAGAGDTLTGQAAYGDWRTDAPGVRRLIRPDDLPPPFTTPSVANGGALGGRPSNLMPKVPPGFTISIFANDLIQPRVVRVAPNGDIFVAESFNHQVRVLRAPDGAASRASNDVFAAHLNQPYGIAFYPPGPDPHYVYVAETNRVVRFPYQAGDTKARGPAEVVVPELPTGGHWTRDIAFTSDGKTMYVSVGSGSNDAETLPRRDNSDIFPFEMRRGLGAAWGAEEWRADVLAFDPDGGHQRVFATGLRNCSGETMRPGTDELWCATNERDGFGDNLPPDYVTHVQAGAFYGWPWYYIGAHEDPHHAGERHDLAAKVTVPDVLLQPHSAPLGIVFYTATQFPEEYRGGAFVTMQGSWNRAKRTGNKVVRLIFKDGKPTGEYEDFMIGLVQDEVTIYGQPVGIAVAHDGALLVSDEPEGIVWRIAYGQ